MEAVLKPLVQRLHAAGAAVAALALAAADKPATRRPPAPDFHYRDSRLPGAGRLVPTESGRVDAS